MTGTVEGVSLRTTRLRDIDGVVWHVPNGEILRVGNKSQQWSRAVVDVAGRVPGRRRRGHRGDPHGHRRRCGTTPSSPSMILAEPSVLGVESVRDRAGS